MKRNMELIRQIALRIEESPEGYAGPEFHVPGYEEKELGYHVLLIMEGGLLLGYDVTSMADMTPRAIPTRLT